MAECGVRSPAGLNGSGTSEHTVFLAPLYTMLVPWCGYGRDIAS